MARPVPKLSSQILEEAANWLIDFRESDGDAAAREEFNAWLRRSPEHVRAYLEISALWEDAQALKNPGREKIEVLVARARAEHNIVPFAEIVSTQGDSVAHAGKHAAVAIPHAYSRRRWVALVASVLIALGAGIGAWIYEQRDVYDTTIGEQRSITLEDGSSVRLNSRSRLKVRFTASERRIELLAGQALFRVAKNPARPFVVRADGTAVRAVGTQFDVYRKSGGTIVTVIEGRVAVIPQASAVAVKAAETSVPGESFTPGVVSDLRGQHSVHRGADARRELPLSAGEQMRITPVAVEQPTRANIATVTAWTEQRLIFEETPLREVVEEFNRYNRQQFVIGDPDLAEFHVTGVFPSTDSSRMLEFLRQRFGVTTSSSGEKIVISRRPSVPF